MAQMPTTKMREHLQFHGILILLNVLFLSFGKQFNFLSSKGSLPATEYDALYDFYEATNGEYWDWTNGTTRWNFTVYDLSAPCSNSWQGITCSCLKGSCQVQQLDLSHYNLSGTLPSSIGAFPSMTNLLLARNNITGTLPTEITNLKLLKVLDLHINQMLGSLPSTIGNLSALNSLFLWRNFFDGTLPSSIYNCTGLVFLQLQYNSFQGTLSSAVENWINLATLKLDGNEFTGSIPRAIGKLQNLSTFEVDGNSFNGTIPLEFYSLSNAKIIDLAHNYFTGSLPPEIGNLTSLVSWICDDNLFFGTLPDAWFTSQVPMRSIDLVGNLFSGSINLMANWKSTLQTVFINDNSFTGTLSKELNDIEALLSIILDDNFFHGPVTGLFENQTSMVYIDWASNSFSGSLPSSLKWKYLLSYILAENQFSGTFPSNFYNSTEMYYVDVSFNHLDGTLPRYFNIPKLFSILTYLNFSSNYFSGSLENTFENVSTLVTLCLSYNQLTGRIPVRYGGLPRLYYLLLDHNHLTGALPDSLGLLRNLKVLFLQNNQISGTIGNMFEWNSLEVSDVSNNLLTGALPYFVSGNPKVQTFDASSNCFSGNIPKQLCSVTSFQVLSLDGLSTASGCRSPIFPGSSLLKAFTLENSFVNGIPECIFTMPNLQTLHLSGNGLTGSLPSNVVISESLKDLSLSHNRLSGTIPLNFQKRHWDNFDLSYNQITGLLSDDFASYSANQSLSLEVNRLSGNIPTTLIDAPMIEILNGNMFACNNNRNKIPKHDSSAKEYSCGSDVVNSILYTWLGIVFFWILFFLLLRRARQRNYGYSDAVHKENEATFLSDIINYIWLVQKWRQTFLECCRPPISPTSSPTNTISSSGGNSLTNTDSSSLTSPRLTFEEYHRVFKLALFLQKVRLLFCLLTLFLICVLMPIYIGLSSFYQTFSESYVWVLSSLLLSGQSAGTAMIVLYFVTILLLFLLFKVIISPYKNRPDRKSTFSSERFHSTFESMWRKRGESTTEDLPQDGNEEAGTSTRRPISSKSIHNIEQSKRYFRASITQENTNRIAYLSLVVVGVGNCFIMILADIFYVLIILRYNIFVISLAEICLAGFKTLLNTRILWKAISFVQSFFHPEQQQKQKRTAVQVEDEYSIEGSYKYTARDLSFLSFTIFLNNLVFPAIAILVISSDCFNNALIAASEVSLTYDYSICVRYGGGGQNCIEGDSYSIVSTYSPPFFYSFQCASRIVITYAAVFISMFILEGFLQPVYKLGVKFLYDREMERRRKENDISSKLNGERTDPHKIAESVSGGEIPCGDLKNPVEAVVENPILSSSNGGTSNPQSVDAVTTSKKPIPWYYRLLFATLPSNLHQLIAEPSYEIRSALLLFDKNRLVVKLNAYLVVFMSFGVLFPPLALIICITVISLTMYEETVIGRLFYESDRTGHSWYKKQIDRNCSGISNGLKHSLWTLAPAPCLMYSYLIFDTWGDTEGWEAAITPTIIMLILPSCLLFMYSRREWFWTSLRFHNSSDEVNKERPISATSGISLTPIHTNNNTDTTVHDANLGRPLPQLPVRKSSFAEADGEDDEKDASKSDRKSFTKLAVRLSNSFDAMGSHPALQSYPGDDSDSESDPISNV